MKKKVIILGASGACLDILSIIEDINLHGNDKIDFIGFFEDNIKKIPERIKKFHIGKFDSNYQKYEDVFFVTAFGNEKNYLKRPKIINGLNIPKNRFINIIHPTCLLSEHAIIGKGNVFHAFVTIARDVKIMDQVVILPKSTISHDTTIESFNIINTNCIISGDVVLEQNCYIGAGSNIRDHVKIKSGSLIGMGSVVTKDINKSGIYFGNPARLNSQKKS